MDFANLPLFSVMRAKMAYMSERQGVLAQNIANADTPGYQAKEVSEPNFKDMLSSSAQNVQPHLQMMNTNGKHLNASSTNAINFTIVNRDSTYERNPTGNNVTIEEEMSKVAANQAEYQKVLNIYRKSVDMFKIAIGKQGG